MLMMRILDLQPVSKERTLSHDSIIVYLVTSANHYVKWTDLVAVEDVSPQGIRTREVVRTT